MHARIDEIKCLVNAAVLYWLPGERLPHCGHTRDIEPLSISI
jgi:hypothetical protein